MTHLTATSDLEYALCLVAGAVGTVPHERAAGHEGAVAWLQGCESLPDAVLASFIREVGPAAGSLPGIIRELQLVAACALLDRSTRKAFVDA